MRLRASPALCMAAGLAVAVAASAHLAGYRVNTTGSMPLGLWHVGRGDALMRGTIVTFCPPLTASFRVAAARGYIGSGYCPGGHEALVKPVIAVAGDQVTVSEAGLAVNGSRVAGTGLRHADTAGRPLGHVAFGTYGVDPGSVWLASSHDDRSFDSRYFGPVPIASVQGIARPVWVW